MRLKALSSTIITLALVLSACAEGAPTATVVLTSTVTSLPTSVLTTTPVPLPSATPLSTSTPTPVPVSIPEIIKALEPSVVHIQTEAVRLDQFNQPGPGSGVGTGAILDTKGHILTNNHVVEGAQRILVTLNDGRVLEAELIGGDPSIDLAIVRIEGEGLIPIPIGDSSTLQVGDQVVAIGHALDLPGGPTVTVGWVSALGRSIAFDEAITIEPLIQTDAAINPGNSGGPLVNLDGEVVGINTAKIPTGEGIGFAIAITPALPLIEELITTGRIGRGFLGVSAVNITEALAINNGLPVIKGVGIIAVAPASPAEQAGLRAGDIIVRVAGNEADNLGDLGNILIEYRQGVSVEIEFYRGDQRQTITVTLGERPR